MSSRSKTSKKIPKASQKLGIRAQQIQAKRAKLEQQLADITKRLNKLDGDLAVVLQEVVAAL